MPKTSTERSRVHRERKRWPEDPLAVNVKSPPKTNAERCRAYGERQRALKNIVQLPANASADRVQGYGEKQRKLKSILKPLAKATTERAQKRQMAFKVIVNSPTLHVLPKLTRIKDNSDAPSTSSDTSKFSERNFISSDGSPWQPKKNARICSQHFVGNKKSKHPLSPSYVPTIFPDLYGKNKRPETGQQASERFNRTLKRQATKTCVESPTKLLDGIARPSDDVSESEKDSTAVQRDKMTQVDFLEEPNNLILFICNRFDYGVTCHAEVQAAIPLIEGDVFKEKKVIKKNPTGIYTVPVYHAVGSNNQAISLIKSTSKFHENSSVKSHQRNIDATSSFSSHIENEKMDVQEDHCHTIISKEAEFVLPDTNYKETTDFESNLCEKIKSEPLDADIKCEETEIKFEDTGHADNIVNSDEIKMGSVDRNNTSVNEHFSSNSSGIKVVIKCDPFIKQEIDDTTVSTSER